jgi:hypothetical protein
VELILVCLLVGVLCEEVTVEAAGGVGAVDFLYVRDCFAGGLVVRID